MRFVSPRRTRGAGAGDDRIARSPEGPVRIPAGLVSGESTVASLAVPTRPVPDLGRGGAAAADPGRSGHSLLRTLRGPVPRPPSARQRPPVRGAEGLAGGRVLHDRARRLHAAARQLVRDGGGRIPRTVEELEQLPGVGRYIARAIASLAFGVPVVALEANGLRVAARWTREEADPRTARTRTRLEAALVRELPPSSPGPFNEAVMELGETICLPEAPRCPVCPVSFACRAFRELDDPASVPRSPAGRRRPHVRGAVVVLAERGRWLVQRRPSGGLLGELWEFPGGKIEVGEAPAHAARRELTEETGASVRRLFPVGVVRHGYSHFSVELHVFRGTPGSPPARNGPGPPLVHPRGAEAAAPSPGDGEDRRPAQRAG